MNILKNINFKHFLIFLLGILIIYILYKIYEQNKEHYSNDEVCSSNYNTPISQRKNSKVLSISFIKNLNFNSSIGLNPNINNQGASITDQGALMPISSNDKKILFNFDSIKDIFHESSFTVSFDIKLQKANTPYVNTLFKIGHKDSPNSKALHIGFQHQSNALVDEIYITIPEEGKVLSLAEVEVIDSSGNNLCRTMTNSVSQSSTAYTISSADKAVDGNTSGLWSNGSVTHTQTESNPWWKCVWNTPISLSSISSVKVYNRTDYKDRLNGARISFKYNNNHVIDYGTYNDITVTSMEFTVNTTNTYIDKMGTGRLFVKHHNNKGFYTTPYLINYNQLYNLTYVYTNRVNKALYIDGNLITNTEEYNSSSDDTDLAVNLDNIVKENRICQIGPYSGIMKNFYITNNTLNTEEINNISKIELYYPLMVGKTYLNYDSNYSIGTNNFPSSDLTFSGDTNQVFNVTNSIPHHFADFRNNKILKLGNSLKNIFNKRSFTISCWIKPQANSEMCLFNFFNTGTTNKELYILLNNYVSTSNRFKLKFAFFGNDVTTSQHVIVKDTWNHVSFVYKLDVGKFIYVNGEEVTLNGSGGDPLDLSGMPSNKFSIGVRQLVQNYLNANMFDLRLFNYAISPEKAKELGHSTLNLSLKDNTYGLKSTINNNSLMELSFNRQSVNMSTGVADFTGDITSGNYPTYISNPTNSGFINHYFNRTSFSISFWMYPTLFNTSGTSKRHILNYYKDRADNKNLHIILHITSIDNKTKLKFGFWNNDLDTTEGSIKKNVWTHITCVFDINVGKKIYINGRLNAENTQTYPLLVDDGSEFFLGRSQFNNSVTHYKGKLFDLKISNYALNEEEIKNISTLKTLIPLSTNLNNITNNENSNFNMELVKTNSDLSVSNGIILFSDNHYLKTNINSQKYFTGIFNNSSFSLSCWVKFNYLDSDNTQKALFGFDADDGINNNNSRFNIHLFKSSNESYNNKIRFGFYGNDLDTSKRFTRNSWYHLTFSFENGIGKTIYLNGKNLNSNNQTDSFQVNDVNANKLFTIGAMYTSSTSTIKYSLGTQMYNLGIKSTYTNIFDAFKEFEMKLHYPLKNNNLINLNTSNIYNFASYEDNINSLEGNAIINHNYAHFHSTKYLELHEISRRIFDRKSFSISLMIKLDQLVGEQTIASFRGSNTTLNNDTSDPAGYYKNLVFSVLETGEVKLTFTGSEYKTNKRLIPNKWYHLIANYEYFDKLNDDNTNKTRDNYGEFSIYIDRQKATHTNISGTDNNKDPLTLDLTNPKLQIGRLLSESTGTQPVWKTPINTLTGQIYDLYLCNYVKKYLYFPLRNDILNDNYDYGDFFSDQQYTLQNNGSYTMGFYDGACNFQGPNKFLRLDNSFKNSFINNGSFSVSCFVCFEKINNLNYIMALGDNKGNGSSLIIRREIIGSDHYIRFAFVGSRIFIKLNEDECVINSKKFIHFSFVYELGKGKRIYVNGVRRKEILILPGHNNPGNEKIPLNLSAASDDTLVIGCNNDGTNNLEGMICDLRFSNYDLDDNEAYELYKHITPNEYYSGIILIDSDTGNHLALKDGNLIKANKQAVDGSFSFSIDETETYKVWDTKTTNTSRSGVHKLIFDGHLKIYYDNNLVFKSSNTIPGLLLNLRELSILDKNVHSKVWSYLNHNAISSSDGIYEFNLGSNESKVIMQNNGYFLIINNKGNLFIRKNSVKIDNYIGKTVKIVSAYQGRHLYRSHFSGDPDEKRISTVSSIDGLVNQIPTHSNVTWEIESNVNNKFLIKSNREQNPSSISNKVYLHRTSADKATNTTDAIISAWTNDDGFKIEQTEYDGFFKIKSWQGDYLKVTNSSIPEDTNHKYVRCGIPPEISNIESNYSFCFQTNDVNNYVRYKDYALFFNDNNVKIDRTGDYNGIPYWKFLQTNSFDFKEIKIGKKSDNSNNFILFTVSRYDYTENTSQQKRIFQSDLDNFVFGHWANKYNGLYLVDAWKKNTEIISSANQYKFVINLMSVNGSKITYQHKFLQDTNYTTAFDNTTAYNLRENSILTLNKGSLSGETSVCNVAEIFYIQTQTTDNSVILESVKDYLANRYGSGSGTINLDYELDNYYKTYPHIHVKPNKNIVFDMKTHYNSGFVFDNSSYNFSNNTLPLSTVSTNIKFKFNGKIQIFNGSTLLYQSNNTVLGDNFQLNNQGELEIYKDSILIWSSNNEEEPGIIPPDIDANLQPSIQISVGSSPTISKTISGIANLEYYEISEIVNKFNWDRKIIEQQNYNYSISDNIFEVKQNNKTSLTVTRIDINSGWNLNLNFELPLKSEYAYAVQRPSTVLPEFLIIHIGNLLASEGKKTKISSVIIVPNLHYYQNIDILDRSNWNADDTFGYTFKLTFNRNTITVTRINTSDYGWGMGLMLKLPIKPEFRYLIDDIPIPTTTSLPPTTTSLTPTTTAFPPTTTAFPPTTTAFPPTTTSLPPTTTPSIFTPIVCSDSEYISNYNELLESNYNPSNITGTDTSVIPNCVSISECIDNQFVSKLPDLVSDTTHIYSIGKYKSNLQCTNISRCNETYPDVYPQDPSVAGRINQYRKEEAVMGNIYTLGRDADCRYFSEPERCVDGNFRQYVAAVPDYDSLTGEYTSDKIYNYITEIDSSCTTGQVITSSLIPPGQVTTSSMPVPTNSMPMSTSSMPMTTSSMPMSTSSMPMSTSSMPIFESFIKMDNGNMS